MCRAWVALFIVGCNDAPSIVDAGSDADSNVLASEVPFSATGPWRTKLPATTPIATNSDAIVANIQADIKNNYGTFAINTDTYSSPIWTAPQNAKVSDFTFNGCQGSLDSQFAACLKGVPTVAEMFPSLGTDSEITIYSPSLDEEWEFWVAKSDDAGAWSACWGGCITGVKANPGIFPAPIGATASGLPLLGFLVRIDELAAGEITHAINICVVRTQATNFSWPANRTDGNTADSDVLMEGQRLRLDPTFDVSTGALPSFSSRERAIPQRRWRSR